jgi:toxin-antitoxin system PIN domain toxin
VKLLDANVLLYAYDSDSEHHAACRTWLDQAFNSAEAIAIPWQTVLAFIRIATNSRAVRQPLAGTEACAIVNTWLERPNAVLLEPGGRFWPILQAQIRDAKVSGPLITDAALAALALEHGATLCSSDRDFRRFDGLSLLDPSRLDSSR